MRDESCILYSDFILRFLAGLSSVTRTFSPISWFKVITWIGRLFSDFPRFVLLPELCASNMVESTVQSVAGSSFKCTITEWWVEVFTLFSFVATSFFVQKRCTAVAGALTTNMLSSTLCRDADFLINIYCSHIRPQLEYGSPLWNMGYVGDLQLLERIQRRWTKAIVNMEDLPYEHRLQSLNLYSVYGRLLRADLILVWKIFHGQSAINPTDIFEISCSQSTRGHPFKLQVKRSRLDIRKRFFSNRVVPSWNGLSAEAVEAPNVNKFKALIHRDLGEELFKFH